MVLLCFDGSDDVSVAIAKAGESLSARAAMVLTVWEPVASWAPYDPATILTAPLSRLAANEMGFDEIVRELAFLGSVSSAVVFTRSVRACGSAPRR